MLSEVEDRACQPRTGLVIVATVFLVRAAVRFRARRAPWYRENTMVASGPTTDARRVATARLLRQHEFSINLMACVEPTWRPGAAAAKAEDRSGCATSARVPIVADAPELLELIDQLNVNHVIIAGAASLQDANGNCIAHTGDRDVHVNMVHDWGELVSAHLEVRQLASVPLLSVPTVTVDPGVASASERTFDAVVTLAALILLSPVGVACAITMRARLAGARSSSASAASARTTVASRKIPLKFRSPCVDAKRTQGRGRGDELPRRRHGASGIFEIDKTLVRPGRRLPAPHVARRAPAAGERPARRGGTFVSNAP